MKYNKSDIMKEAWRYHRQYTGYSWSSCLRRAWKLAKEAYQEAHKITFNKKATMDYLGTLVDFRLWEKGGKRRIYCTYGSGDGYVDLNSGKIFAGRKSTPCIEQFLRFYKIA